MYLFELENITPLKTALVAVTDQLKSDIDHGDRDAKMSVDGLLDYFMRYDIMLDRTDLYKMIKTAPLKNIISNIKGNEVVFRGYGEPTNADASQNEKIVKQMASRAAKT